MSIFFFFYLYCAHRDLHLLTHSFPTRRSSDLDTALDFAASLVTLFGVRFAAMPADRNHRFGHGKAEALVDLFQVVLIIVASIGIALRAIERIGRSEEHTSELQSLMRISYAVFCLKKKKTIQKQQITNHI